MKVGQNGVYDSAEDYMECVRLWVAMTFFDGHAAMAPHCRARGQSGSCGNALWPVAEPSGLRCRTKGCSHPVEFSCRVKSHDNLCGRCASRSIVNHMGGPGPNASTHIYDCKIKNVDSDGVVYLTGFQSRNPPPSPIHWRTTKRLSPPNLVGVVLLQAKGSPLMETDAIKWGEIVFHGQSRHEDSRRQNGELAINLFNITNDFDPDYFEEGGYLAVIDCMTFVPEWIPVLHALENQKETKLPFDNGRFLNLWREEAAATTNSALDGSTPETPSDFDVSRLIDDMIENSEIEPIREIRRDATLKDQLVVQLENLATTTTLDKMQLLSFVGSLRNPVHLTQGPPGTGKSYLGVVLVRALIIIRDLWMRKSHSTAVFPILVLSYKNHAIDEFLVDLVKAETSLNQNKLIRIGGQCKDPRLMLFSERSAYHTDAEVKASRSILDQLNTLKDSIQATIDGSISSFLSYYQLMFFETDPQTKRKAATDATAILMECVIRHHLLIAATSLPTSKTPADIISKFVFLELVGQDLRSSRKVKDLVNHWDGSALICSLVEGMSHYGQEHWGDVLLKWLSGRFPLPRCRYARESSGEVCSELSISQDISLCDKHRCTFQLSNDERCEEGCSQSSSFCEDHCCREPDCTRSRVPGTQVFCQVHACKRCVELGVRSDLANDDPPRNVCDKHPICLSPFCQEYSSEESLYCLSHSTVQCMALTKKGNPCKGRAVSRMRPFCRDHESLADTLIDKTFGTLEVDEPAQSQEKQRCVFIKRKGGRCKGSCVTGAEYCSDHRDLVLTTEKEVVFFNKSELRLGNDNTTPSDGSIEKRTNEITNQENSNLTEEPNQGDMDVDSSSTCSEGSIQQEPDVKIVPETDEMEFEEGENLQHLREVFEVGDDDDSSCGSSESIVSLNGESDGDGDAVTGNLLESDEAVDVNPCQWAWDMSIEERWGACQSLMDILRKLLTETLVEVKLAVLVARKNFLGAKVRAKAKVYENKSIIGGTMVGCITRLESIRKTRPFAVIVEEASEVLEPLLFSCLSEATVKLEMIGDHRQLQPSVMSRFDFELCNKVNVSMFQRLIEAPQGHHVPSTVLSVQRRMRTNICDLTRNFYSDVTRIEDHEICGRQLIGQRNAQSRGLVEETTTSGREIPGVGPHVFLWTHSGEQRRARVGVSRMNQLEAQMACSLAAYLVECGVPRSSIALLTPYKGQLMEMRDILFKDSRISAMRLLSRDPGSRDVCRLSTIDRFQGDEEDVIICSLVVDENSRTGFVKLVNRMVVLLSRARLGLYVLGNTAYFENQGVPKHWATTFELLQRETPSDSTAIADDKLQNIFSGERTGKRLPLCCPIHRNVTASAISSDQLRLGFCTESCQQVLSCGHACSLSCHWPKKAHNAMCSVQFESPCERHGGKLKCYDVFRNAGPAPLNTKSDEILQYYLCPKPVELTLPCGHVIKKPCFEERKIAAGEQSMPSCNKPSPIPYMFPSCGHILPVSCNELVRFRDDPDLVNCKQSEEYEPPCGHSKTMLCWKKNRILDKKEAFLCDEKVSVSLPRCGHKREVSCRVSDSLGLWLGTRCDEIGIVHEGVAYGPQDYPCRMQAIMVRQCGHSLNLPCSEAFAESVSIRPCRQLVNARHPKVSTSSFGSHNRLCRMIVYPHTLFTCFSVDTNAGYVASKLSH